MSSARIVRAEWTKLRSVPSTFWLVLLAVATTIGFSVLVSSAVDTAGGTPGCHPGAPGCGDEDVMIDSLSGAYFGQIAVIALGVVFAAKVAVLAAPVLITALLASVGSFLLGQPILHGNGFVPSQGYPVVSITDPDAARAVIGTALYLVAIGMFAFGIGTIVRRTGSAIAVALTIVYAPAIVSLMLAEPLRDWVQRLSPMMAGLSVQATVPRADSVPIGPWAGLGVTAAWAAVALVIALWLVRRRDV